MRTLKHGEPPVPRKRLMTGYASVNDCYQFAGPILFPDCMTLTVTRCRYATLAEMARNGGDLKLKDVGRRASRLLTLRGWGLVRYVSSLRRWELTTEGWNLLVNTEAAYYLSLESF